MLKVLFTAFLISVLGCGQLVPVANVVDPRGQVEVKANPQAPYQSAKDKDPITEGGGIKTGEKSNVKAVFPGRGEVIINSNTCFQVSSNQILGLQTEGTAVYHIQKGKGEICVETPQGMTAVLGTIFTINVGKEGTIVSVDEGKVGFTPKGGKEQKVVEAGQQLIIDSSGKIRSLKPLPKLNPNLYHPR